MINWQHAILRLSSSLAKICKAIFGRIFISLGTCYSIANLFAGFRINVASLNFVGKPLKSPLKGTVFFNTVWWL